MRYAVLISSLIATIVSRPSAVLGAAIGPVGGDLSSSDSSLTKRASCTTSSTCTSSGIPYGSQPYCLNKTCTWICKPEFYSRGTYCVRRRTSSASATAKTSTTRAAIAIITTATTTRVTTTTTRTTTTASTPTYTGRRLYDAQFASKNVTGFKAQTLGWNTNAVVSWFRTNSTQDFTNGNSWCYFPYADYVPGVAISYKTMMTNFGGNQELAGAGYCGAEMEVQTPTGLHKLYVSDAFDDFWLRTPTSLDVVIGAFDELFGRNTTDKNDVVQGAQWRFTGKRDSRYMWRSKTSLERF